MRLQFLTFEDGEERLSWGNLGESSKPPEKAHNLETDVATAQRERRKLQVLAAKKKTGFKQHRDKVAAHRAATPEPVRLLTVTDENGVRYSVWG
jgi:hypothetical protein